MSWRDLPGWFDYADLYDRAVEDARPGDPLVEVGVALGRSVAYLTRRAIDSGKGLHIVAVDVWQTDPRPPPGTPTTDEDWMGWTGRYHELWERHGGTFAVFLAGMTEHAREELEALSVVRLPSVQAARAFADRSLAFVFVDAEHDYGNVKADIAAWLPKVRYGGMLAGHDYAPQYPGVRQAVDEAFGTGRGVSSSSWAVRV